MWEEITAKKLSQKYSWVLSTELFRLSEAKNCCACKSIIIATREENEFYKPISGMDQEKY